MPGRDVILYYNVEYQPPKPGPTLETGSTGYTCTDTKTERFAPTGP